MTGQRRTRTRPGRFVLVPLAALSLAAAACASTDDATRSVPIRELLATDLGGDTTRTVVNRNAFGLPATDLPGSDRTRFEVGDSFFTQNWVTAPASTTNRDGLGPTFNATACAGCHTLDGPAAPPTEDDPHATGLLLRLSVPGRGEHGAPKADEVYGGQLQDRAIDGVPAEGTIVIERRTIRGTFDDGTPYELEAPTYSIADPAFGPLPDDLMIGPRLAPSVIGMGLLEVVPASGLRAAADPDDVDGDGISGRVNTVWDAVSGRRSVGRFGWKANVATVREQSAGAFAGDMGITSVVNPEENCPAAQAACAAAPVGGTPDITDDNLDDVVFYTRVLAVPAARDAERPVVRRGAKVFAEAGCASCHTPTLHTGRSDVEVLSNQTIHPFTDLLLHDMGEGLADGRPDHGATGSEWRTSPLWGIGLREAVSGHTRFLHDGRARSLMEAVLWHGGEAAASRDEVIARSAADRDALIAFLESR